MIAMKDILANEMSYNQNAERAEFRRFYSKLTPGSKRFERKLH